MWLIMTDQDTISVSDGQSFWTYLLLSIMNVWDFLTKPDQLEKNYSWLIDGININILKVPYWSQSTSLSLIQTFINH